MSTQRPGIEPVSSGLPAGWRFDDAPLPAGGRRWTLTADPGAVAAASTGRFAHPGPGVDLVVDPAAGERWRVGGCAFTQFGLPVWAGPDLDFDFEPADNLRAPPAMQPCWFRLAEDDWALLAPIRHWHDQIVSLVETDDGRRLRWGPHGDLTQVAPDWSIELEVRRGPSLRALIGAWGAGVRERAATVDVDRHLDVATSHLSYWTDNGAAYWYRNEPGRSLAQTVVDVVDDLDERDVPIRAVELDSWFYDHEVARPVSPDDYPEEVPPTGLLRWEARADTVPMGMPAFAEALDGHPLILHSRHLSIHADGVDDDWWLDRCAHPSDPSWFRGWFERARAWGATTIEQDWMLLYWFGVRQLREGSGRAAEWLDTLDALAAEHDLHLWFCMANPPDIVHAATLRRVSAIRTSDDYRFADDPALLWRWFLTVNLLADGLGIPAFKDCFFSAGVDDLDTPGPTDGDPHHEVEALLSALSAGPVGIGDRIGRTETAIVARCVRADGRIVAPDRPLVIRDDDLDPAGEVTWASTVAGDSVVVVALHTGPGDAAAAGWPLRDAVAAAGVAPGGDAPAWVVYDWRARTARIVEAESDLRVTLGRRDWAQLVLVPLAPDGPTLLGDLDRHTTLGAARVHGDRVLGEPGERVALGWFTADGEVVTVVVEIGADGTSPVSGGLPRS